MYVLCIDKNRTPVDLLHPKIARDFLNQGRAVVFSQYPYVLILKEETTAHGEYILKIDPGSHITGISIVKIQGYTEVVVWAAQIVHHRKLIVSSLKSRSASRRLRRSRKTPYRKARFLNRRGKEDQLPPSAESCLSNIETWAKRLNKYCPISSVSVEINKFDPQKAINPQIRGKEYQEGPLKEHKNIRSKLLATKDCCYRCKRSFTELNKLGIRLERDHIISKKHGGSNSSRNAALICRECNLKKGKGDGGKVESLAGMSAMNQIRYILPKRLGNLGLVVNCYDGKSTSENVEKFVCSKEIKKSHRDEFHWIDASCIGKISGLKSEVESILIIESRGHGTRQMCQTDAYGIPKQHRKKEKKSDIKTGDMVRHKETNVVSFVTGARASGSIETKDGIKRKSITHKKLDVVRRNDGYFYSTKKPLSFASGFFKTNMADAVIA